MSWVRDLSVRDLADLFLLTRERTVIWSKLAGVEESVLAFFLLGMMQDLFLFPFLGLGSCRLATATGHVV